MAHSFHKVIKNVEEALADNKWFILACLSLGVFTLFVSITVHKITGEAFYNSDGRMSCIEGTQEMLYGPANNSTSWDEIAFDPATIGDVTSARSFFYNCLLENRIDIRSVATFETLFPGSELYSAGTTFEVQESFVDPIVE